MPPIERPITISQPLWEFICLSVPGFTPEVLKTLLEEEGYEIPVAAGRHVLMDLLAENPGPFLLRVGILKRPELLLGAVLSLLVEPGVEVEYVMKERTIEGLVRGEVAYVVFRLLDNQERFLTHDQLVRAIFGGALVDYLEKTGD